MSGSAAHRLSRLAGVLLGSSLLLAVTSGSATAQDGSAPPPSLAPSGAPFTYDDTAIPVAPMPGGIVDPQPVGWDHITVWPDGVTLTIYFWNGAEACFGLDRVELTDVDGTLAITLWVGFRVDAANKRCAAIEQLYSTVVTLDEPILGGGTPGLEGVQEPMGGQPVEPGAQLSTMEPGPCDQVDLGPDGQTGWVFFEGGDRACYGFGGIGVSEANGLTILSVYSGLLVTAPQVCTAIGISFRAPFSLDAPLLLGGAA